MSTGRFALLVASLAALVAAGSFAIAYRVLDDESAARPPSAPTSGLAEPTATEPPTAVTSTTSAPITEPGALDTPTWVVVVASGTSRPDADATARRVARSGRPAGVLHTSDYSSLAKGLWVAYAGPYPDAEAAQSAVDRLAADGFTGAYVRCVGDRKDCSPSEGQD